MVGRSWQCPQPREDLREHVLAGRQPQRELAAVADERTGKLISQRRRVAIIALLPRMPWTSEYGDAAGGGGEQALGSRGPRPAVRCSRV